MKNHLLILLALLIPLAAVADEPQGDDSSVTSDEVRIAMADAQTEYKDVLSQRAQQATSSPSRTAALAGESLLDSKKTSTMEELALQVDALKNRVIVERSALIATQSPKKVRVQGGKTIFTYKEDAIYEVTAAVDHITDITLKKGEALTASPSTADDTRWIISAMKSGAGENERTHLIVKPLDEDIDTNIIITTDQNVYHINLKSGDYYMPAVSWNYPRDIKASVDSALRKEQSQELTIKPEDLRFKYEIDGKDYDWKPIRVFDDGTKTFIQMPNGFRASEAPVLFLLDDDSDPMIVNYRVKGDLYIVDRLIEKAELRVGASRSVRITLDDEKNFFQRLFS